MADRRDHVVGNNLLMMTKTLEVERQSAGNAVTGQRPQPPHGRFARKHRAQQLIQRGTVGNAATIGLETFVSRALGKSKCLA